MNIQRIGGNLSPLTHKFPGKVQQGDILPSCFSSHPENKCSFCSPFCLHLVLTTSFQAACELRSDDAQGRNRGTHSGIGGI